MTIFSLAHITYLLICTLICVSFYFIFKNKSYKVKYIATFIPLAISFVIHFLKLLIPEYRNNLPYSIISITAETVCAVSTLSFPFIYLSKNKPLKDYMVVIGIISGILTLIIPGDILGYSPTNIEVVRFFFAHLTLFLSPFFMCVFNIYRPNEKWIKHTLITFLVVAIIIIINGILFTFILEGKEAGVEFLKELGLIR